MSVRQKTLTGRRKTKATIQAMAKILALPAKCNKKSDGVQVFALILFEILWEPISRKSLSLIKMKN